MTVIVVVYLILHVYWFEIRVNKFLSKYVIVLDSPCVVSFVNYICVTEINVIGFPTKYG